MTGRALLFGVFIVPAMDAKQGSHATRASEPEGEIADRASPHEPTPGAGEARCVTQPVHYDADAPPASNRPAAGVKQRGAKSRSRAPHVHNGDRRPPIRRDGGETPHPAPRGGQSQGGGGRKKEDGKTL